MGHTVIEMEYMRAQIAQAKALHDALPKIAASLKTIEAHLETIAVSSEALLDDHFTGGDPQ